MVEQLKRGKTAREILNNIPEMALEYFVLILKRFHVIFESMCVAQHVNEIPRNEV